MLGVQAALAILAGSRGRPLLRDAGSTLRSETRLTMAKGKSDKPGRDEVQVKLVFRIPAGMPTLATQHFTVQFEDDQFILCFYDAHVPPLLGTDAEREEAMETLRSEGVVANCVARLAVSPSKYERIVEVMNETLAKWRASHDTSTADRSEH